MNKQDIYNAFGQNVSLKSIIYRETEYGLQGKYCFIAPLGNNKFDIWIGDPNNLAKGLGQRKLRNIVTKLSKSLSGSKFTELTCEGYGVIEGTELILSNLDLLRIGRKRTLSPETLEKRRAQLANVRKKRKVSRGEPDYTKEVA